MVYHGPVRRSPWAWLPTVGIVVASGLVDGCGLSSEGLSSTTAAGASSSTSSGTGGTSTTTTTTTSTSGTGAGGSGGAAPEQCDNGVDDDGDGDVDCDDAADCGDFTCVPAVDGATYVEDAPACSPGFAAAPFRDCSLCRCGGCEVEVGLWENKTCDGAAKKTLTLHPMGCSDIGNITAAAGEKVGISGTTLGDGPCAPIADDTPRSLCATAQSGKCGGGNACVPKAAAPLCVLVDGACPAAYPALAATLVPDAGDATCACSCTGDATCPTEVIHSRDTDNCTGHSHAQLLDGACKDTTDATVMSLFLEPATGCAPDAAPAAASKSLCCAP